METALGTADPCPRFLSNQRTMAKKQVQPARFPSRRGPQASSLSPRAEQMREREPCSRRHAGPGRLSSPPPSEVAGSAGTFSLPFQALH